MNDPRQHAYTPRNPHFAERVRDSFDRQGAMHLLGASISRVEPGLCEIELPFRDDLSQQHGFFHGGVVTAIADSAAGYAAFSLAPPDRTVLSVEFKVNFLAPASGELLVACGEVVKSGRTLCVCDVRVHVERNDVRTLCATMHQTIMNVDKPDAPEGTA